MTDITMDELPEKLQNKLKQLVDISGKSPDTLIKEYNLILNSKDLKNLEISIKYEKAYVILYKRYSNANTVPLMNDSKQIAILHIAGRNKFRIDDNKGEIVFPPTSVTRKDVIWYSSEYYRRLIKTKLESKLKIPKEKATDITDTLCADVTEKIEKLEKNEFFKKHIEEDLQNILNSIESVSLICCPDGNTYHIYIDDKTIKLTDKQLYNEPLAFCIQYLTCFKKKIKITPEEWDEHFIPRIQSDDILETETDKVESTCDMITKKFLRFIKNCKVYDWDDNSKRKQFMKCIFFDVQHDWVMVSTDFVDYFFTKEKISREYKKSQRDWNSYLHRKEDRYLIENSTTGRISSASNAIKRFWIFDPVRTGISEDSIEKQEKSEENESQTVNKYYNIKPKGD